MERLTGFECIFDDRLIVDDEARTRAGPAAVISDEQMKMLGRVNRLGVAKGAVTQLADDSLSDGQTAWLITLAMTAHAHPECEFRWVRLVVDLSTTPDLSISDMSPQTVEGQPIRIETTIGAGLKFSSIARLVDLEAEPSLTRAQDVYHPRIVASGVGFKQAIWDFRSDTGAASHANRELNLLVVAPIGVLVTARFGIRAKARLKGISRLIPLVRRTGRMAMTYTLAG